MCSGLRRNGAANAAYFLLFLAVFFFAFGDFLAAFFLVVFFLVVAISVGSLERTLGPGSCLRRTPAPEEWKQFSTAETSAVVSFQNRNEGKRNLNENPSCALYLPWKKPSSGNRCHLTNCRIFSFRKSEAPLRRRRHNSPIRGDRAAVWDGTPEDANGNRSDGCQDGSSDQNGNRLKIEN